MKSGSTNILIIIFAIGLLVGGAFLLLSRGAPIEGAASVLANTKLSEELLKGERIEKEVLRDRERLQRITFDDALYERSDFRALKPFDPDIPDPELGREQPFAPLP